MSKTLKQGPPRYVDFTHGIDQECALLGALGFATSFINQRTGLTPGKVAYRLRKAEISRREFRTGESVFARLVLRHAREIAQPKLIAHLRAHVPPPQISLAAHTSAWGRHPRPLSEQYSGNGAGRRAA